GDGYFIWRLDDKKNEIYGIDYSPKAIDFAQLFNKNKKVKFIIGPLEKIPFSNEYFDIVVCIAVLEHIIPKNVPIVIKEMHRILKKEGLLTEELHELSQLEPIKYIAVITSKTAQGYFDFLSNLLVPEKMKPIVHLYESTMQGAATAQEVIEAMNRIEQFCMSNKIKYDVVVLIRGGGGPSDLMYFDDYNLAKRTAKMNYFIPVLTGIGHEKDETIPDFVAWKRFPTPTAVAKEISNQLKNYLEIIERSQMEFKQLIDSKIALVNEKLGQNTQKALNDVIERNMKNQYKKLKEYSEILYNSFLLKRYENLLSIEFLKLIATKLDDKLLEFENMIKDGKTGLSKTVELKLQSESQQIEKYQIVSELFERTYGKLLNKIDNLREELIRLGGPLAALSFGGAIVTKSGKMISKKEQLKEREAVNLHFIDGKVIAKVGKIDKSDSDLKI
ncbi:MAG: exodeoxyribonuclease VII large subunit, partial [Fervidobacterium sp.]